MIEEADMMLASIVFHLSITEIEKEFLGHRALVVQSSHKQTVQG